MIIFMLVNKYYHTSSFDLTIKQSLINNGGYGVFTNEFIPQNAHIDYYHGDLIYGLYGGEYYFSISENIGINALNYPRCYMAMLNDASFCPNST